MRGILLVSHGKLAEGMKDTLEMFSGVSKQLDTLSLEPEQDIQEFSQLMKDKIDSVDSGQGVVVFCDLAFGTPSNVAGQLLRVEEYQDRIQIITGMNLPMLLEYTQLRNSSSGFEDVIQIGKEGIINFNQKLNKH